MKCVSHQIINLYVIRHPNENFSHFLMISHGNMRKSAYWYKKVFTRKIFGEFWSAKDFDSPKENKITTKMNACKFNAIFIFWCFQWSLQLKNDFKILRAAMIYSTQQSINPMPTNYGLDLYIGILNWKRKKIRHIQFLYVNFFSRLEFISEFDWTTHGSDLYTIGINWKRKKHAS